MNKRILILAAMSLLSGATSAQAAFDNELDQELAQVSANPQASAPAAATIAPQGSQNGSQPIYILNQATPTANSQAQVHQAQTQVQRQPEVNISAAPLSKSKAEQIREARQQVEVETENKIVEKLETSRMEDERRRAGVLFDAPFNALASQNQQPVQPVYQPAPPPVMPVQQVVAPAPVAPPVEKSLVQEEVRAAMLSEQILPEDRPGRKYFGTTLGIGDYPGVANVRGNYLLGVQFGEKYDDTYQVEGGFTYGNYTVEPPCVGYWSVYNFWVPRLINVQQYQGSAAMKYLFLNGSIRPIVGGVIAYSYRQFNWTQDNGYYGVGSNQSATSHAVDIGAILGVDVEFSRKWSVGLEYRYMWNVMSRVNTSNTSMFLTQQDVFGTPIEKLQYYTLALTATVNF